jgi:dTDP-4-amino-4,6-dideoxygalactose transaminase
MRKGSKLALLGGKPVKTGGFPQHNSIGREEKKLVNAVLDSGILSLFQGNNSAEFYGGPFVKRMEQDFANYFGAKHAVSMNSATSALHAAVFAAGAGPGDEVIVPPYTMSATASAVLMQNAVPVFADIKKNNFCIDPESIRERISEKTKAIIVVHLFGMPADMDEIMEIAKQHNLIVIEDAAQAPGATYKGKYCGTIGHIGVLSLNRHKTIQCGEGGVLLTNSDDFALKCQLLRNHGEVVVEGMGVSNRINVLGHNYRMTELQAAVGIAQLKKLGMLNKHRIKLAEYLAKKLACFDAIKTPEIPGNLKPVYYLYPMLFSEEKAGISRELFVNAVNAEGLPLNTGYVKPIYLEPMYQKKSAFAGTQCPFKCAYYNRNVDYSKGICPVTEQLQEKELIFTNICRYPLKKRDIDIFACAIEKVFDNAEKLKKYAEKKNQDTCSLQG